MVRFNSTYEEYNLIAKICKRARDVYNKAGLTPPDVATLTMDLDAAHSNGAPLDFKKLLEFPQFDFMHDIHGIQTHIDRGTGRLTHCFLPRCHKHTKPS